jgi:hypothetical protein
MHWVAFKDDLAIEVHRESSPAAQAANAAQGSWIWSSNGNAVSTATLVPNRTFHGLLQRAPIGKINAQGVLNQTLLLIVVVCNELRPSNGFHFCF